MKKIPIPRHILGAGVISKAALALLAGLVLLGIAIGQLTESENMEKTDVLKVDGNTIILGVGCRAIVADTTDERAESIGLGIEKTIAERPNSHDVFVDALEAYNISVERATLTRFDGRYYYSDLILKGQERVVKLDLRPSDAVAIAVRADAPIYVNKTLLAEHGEDIC